MTVSVHHGDSREVLKTFADASVDSVVCDPPYALVSIGKRFGADDAAPVKAGKTGAYARASAGFMGQKWDTGETAFDPAFWAEVLRVLKPRGHLLAFGGTRTFGELQVAIAAAGFDIRDSILDLVDPEGAVQAFLNSLNEEQVRAFVRCYDDATWGGLLAWIFGSGFPKSHNQKGDWEGYGSALKPAFEPIVVARPPMIGTIAANLEAHRTGALNIDGCRIGAGGGGERDGEPSAARRYVDQGATNFAPLPGPRGGDARGRWPANVIHDGSAEVIDAFPLTTSGTGAVKRASAEGYQGNALGKESRPAGTPMISHGDSGSAARFFYSAKADAADRCGSKHPTVKPVDLMAYLCRLVTPPGGTVLDPFAGSGSTGMACLREGFDCILIEREAEYVADIKRRLAHVEGADTPLFASAVVSGEAA
ncbi:DNA-methyltransferase [Brevundimonas faecalis]|uniref:DNA-methyltransferase n=1 Tax=Brevundimonas faecalis TaxID=947378 RepID=UPI00361F0D8C